MDPSQSQPGAQHMVQTDQPDMIVTIPGAQIPASDHQPMFGPQVVQGRPVQVQAHPIQVGGPQQIGHPQVVSPVGPQQVNHPQVVSEGEQLPSKMDVEYLVNPFFYTLWVYLRLS